jgi:hypothetical protein
LSNTSITNIEITDTFQVWFNKTNEIIDLANENVMLAGPNGFTIQGNSTLVGTFTANTLTSSTGSINNLSVLTLQRSVDVDERIISISPMGIQASVENIFDLQTTAGNRPILRMINGGNARWVIGQQTALSSSGFSIRTEGSSTPQITISQSGRLVASEFQGNGSLLTNLDANNIVSGTLNIARIPNLDTAKITTGVFSVARIPDLDAAKIAAGTFAVARIPDLAASKVTSGTFAVARIPDLDAAKITSGTMSDNRLSSNIVRTSRVITAGTGLSGGGTLAANITISISNGGVGTDQLSAAERMNTSNVLSRNSAAGAGGIGTYVLGRRVSGGPVDLGEIVSGNNLSASDASGRPRELTSNVVTILGGSWRAMGLTSASGTLAVDSQPRQTTLWLRVS